MNSNKIGIVVLGLILAGAVAFRLSAPSGTQLPPPPPPVVSYSEDRFYWDDVTEPHKDTIVRWVNEIANTSPGCSNLDPSSAYLSNDPARGNESAPAFYVTCSEAGQSWNVYFNRVGIIASERPL